VSVARSVSSAHLGDVRTLGFEKDVLER